MWLFTSTERDFRIWTRASLDMPMSLATSYTRRFLTGIAPRFVLGISARILLLRRLGGLSLRGRLFGRAQDTLLRRRFLGDRARFFARRVGQDRLLACGGSRARGLFGQLATPPLLKLLRLLDQLLGGLLADSLDRENLLHGGAEQILHSLDARADQLLAQLRTGPFQIFDIDPRAALQVLLPVALALRDQIDLPARELCGEPRVLAPLPDRERQLVVRDRDKDLLLRFDDLRLEHLGGGERARHKDDRVLAPGHDVDLLTPQLADDRLHAGAFDPHASADRVDLVVIREHRDLRAGTGLA